MRNGILAVLYIIRTVVVPINFICSLLSTATASMVLVYANSAHTSETDLLDSFGDT